MGSGKGGGGNDYKDAKDLLDKIGQQVHDKVKKDVGAEAYKEALKGNLQHANGSSETVGTNETCELVNQYYTKRLNGNSNRYPCANRSPVRFSDESRSQCTYNRIKDSQQNDNKGACAPFRRLSVCDRNLELMKPNNINTTHKLLAEVCMAAKYEAQSLINYRAQYDAEHHDTGFTTCTMLARSFADIGDVVRGKDLYLGNPQESARRDKLENKLKEIFGDIYKDVMRGRNGQKSAEAEARYKKDEDGNYYQLREDWWDANRETVWKAITCDADGSYFRPTCGDEENKSTRAKDKCRCDKEKGAKADQVPTYFDYVPQYLRWFEEWAEDFCRKRKHKLENAIQKCRYNENGEEKYCSRNGYDCTRTIRGKNKLFSDTECTNCSVVCTPFVDWIDNKKKEFEKQKGKYTKEIEKANGTSNGTSITIGNTTINNLYVKEFYQQLQNDYGDVKKFLGLLNQETTCKKHPKIKDKDYIDFTESTEETFSHTEYCDTCPWCATKKKANGKWEDGEHHDCPPDGFTTHDEKKTNVIKLLLKDKTGKTMVEKLKSLCGNGGNKKNIQEKTWKCYYDKNKEKSIDGGDKDYCILQDGNKDNPQNRTIMPYDVLFPNWINEMLKDSIDWSKELDKCINNKETNNCIHGCKKNCECFEKWVKRMKEEWQQLENHYEEEEFSGNYGMRWTPYMTLEMNLDLSYFRIIKEAHPKEKPVQKMEEIIEQNRGKTDVTKENNSITKFLQQELQEAEKCLQTHKDKCPKPQKPPKQEGGGGARSETFTPPGGPQQPDDGGHESEEQEEEEEDEDEEDQAVDATVNGDGTEVVEETVAEVTDPSVNVCDTVDKLFKDGTTLQAACSTKYVNGREKFPNWKCVPSGEKSGSDSNGAICVPPRRRRLYVKKLHDWASGNTQESGSEARGSESSQAVSGGNTESSDKLREAFIESAAVETFFLWHKYKQLHKPQGGGLVPGVGVAPGIGVAPGVGGGNGDGGEQTPEQQLQSGTIPPDFLRQMFYTLGDYRDILFGDQEVIKTLKDSGDENIKDISDKIKEMLKEQSGEQPSTSGKDPQTWWKEHAPSIWNGMICALTYEDNGEKGKQPKQNNEVYEKFFGTPNGSPVPPVKPGTTGTPTGTFKDKYNYKTVELKEEASGEKNPPKLSDFVLRPPYFRYLEEWGETFCRQRTRMLEKIKEECRNDKVCSGDGEDCKNNLPENPSTFPDFNCPSCATPCGLYKRWIKIKKDEFNKQKEAYTGQKNKCKNESNKGGNGVCGSVTMCNTAADFLNRLKNGPCKKDNENENGKENEEDKLDFDKPDNTFKQAHNCRPCSQFKIDCKSGKCDKTKGEGCKDKKTIVAKDIEEMKDSMEDVFMIVSDNNPNGFDGDLDECVLGNCADVDIFKGFREDVWTCGKVCGYNVCKPKNVNGQNGDGNQIIIIRALFKIWLEYFLEDYNKIKKKLKPCMNKVEQSPCIIDYEKKYKCVKQWIHHKRTEWDKIKKHYLKQNEDGDNNMKSLVKNFLEGLQSQIPVTIDKAIKPCGGLKAFESFCGLNGAEKSKTKGDDERDLVVCFLEKLEKKIEQCKKKHDETSVENGGKSCTPLDNTTLEEPLEETEENQVAQPKICPPPEKEEVKEEGGCDQAPTEPEETASPAPSEGTENQPPVIKPEEEAPPPTPPSPGPTPPPPLPSDNTSDILKTTIPFGIALALTSIALLFLK
ncbi:hypothetical protein PFFVO_00372, partial [Plasmodium falciparum Vietnam Oak-Knoll (FVO)]